MAGKLSLREIATLAIIQEIPDSNLETGRYGPKSGDSQIIQESWQNCSWNVPWVLEAFHVRFLVSVKP